VSSAKPRAKALGLERPTQTRPAFAASVKLPEKEARIVVNVTATQHRALKLRAVSKGLTVKAYVLQLLEKDGRLE
jgi:predicted DNA binding CopG/RHH family protein